MGLPGSLLLLSGVYNLRYDCILTRIYKGMCFPNLGVEWQILVHTKMFLTWFRSESFSDEDMFDRRLKLL